MVWWLRIVWLSVFGSCHLIAASDVKEETKCYAANTFLEPNCGSSHGLVISIDWNATFFGHSTCDQTYCCPDNTVCTVLVRDTDHFQTDHWDNLNACNGQTSCSVHVDRVGIGSGCDPVTDYETVAYRCVPPHITTTEETTTERQTFQQTNTEEVPTSSRGPAVTVGESVQPLTTTTIVTTAQTTVEVEYTSRQGSAVTVSEPEHPVTRTDGQAQQTTEGGRCDCQPNDDVVIAVAVSLSLLLVLSTSLFSYIFYKRGLADGAAGNQPTKEVSDQYLTDLSPADTADIADPQINNGQTTSTYETVANSYYNEPSPEYTGLQLPQYDNLNGCQPADVEPSLVFIGTESNRRVVQATGNTGNSGSVTTDGQSPEYLEVRDVATGSDVN